jgi:hypothetical protein
MTLNITIVAPWGIWQCSDLRLTRWPRGDIVDDYSIKHVTARCTDGTALISYTGLGRVGQYSVSDWLRRTLRGESRTVDDTLSFIREKATSRLGRNAASLGIRHTFIVGAFLAGRPWAAAITNMSPDRPLERPPTRTFNTSALMVGEDYRPMAFVTGAREAVAPEDMTLLDRISTRWPKRPIDYRRLMAEINRRASKQRPFGKLISEACVTAYIPPAGEPFEHETHWWGLTRPSVERQVPSLLFGIDLTELNQVMITNFKDLHSPNPATREEAHKRFDRLVQEAAERSVKPDA